MNIVNLSHETLEMNESERFQIFFEDREVLDSEIVVCMLVYNGGFEVSEAINSIRSQETTRSVGILIIDGGECDDWKIHVNSFEEIAIVNVNNFTVSQSRNFSHQICNMAFLNAKWICRLDSDDILDSQSSIEEIADRLESEGDGKNWAIAGNSLSENGDKIYRKNMPEENICSPEIILPRLRRMVEGEADAELPSCNLWIRAGFRAIYPDIESAEDHWLVCHLMVNQPDEGLILHESLFARYSLTGQNTEKNRSNGSFLLSRQRLLSSVKFWINGERKEVDEICIGWGCEGVVWLTGSTVRKRFHSRLLEQKDVDWLSQLDSSAFPNAVWSKEAETFVASYEYKETIEAESATLAQVSRFIQTCIEDGVVSLNIKRSNFRISDGELLHIDIGHWVRPYNAQFFRDMCLQLYLTYVIGESDDEVREISKGMRNDPKRMSLVSKFESFYHREILLHSYHRGAFVKPKRDVIPKKRHHEDVTLVVRSCSMDAHLIERQSYHILQQLCTHDSFSERVLLIDYHPGPFLRQYAQADPEKLSSVVERLIENEIFDRVLVAPIDKEDLVTACYQRWFNLDSVSPHNQEGAPLFQQLWAFEQMNTRYVLQMDSDVIIGRTKGDDDVITGMLDSLRKPNTFGVGFNIPQKPGTGFKEYSGKFVPEIRLGLFDMKRVLSQAPFPNSIKDERVQKNWHRSIEEFQDGSEWKCLRGGEESSWYLHPMNSMKRDLQFYDRVVDLCEQGVVPMEQAEVWDVIEDKDLWRYPYRPEELVFTILLRDFEKHWTRAAIKSLISQKDTRFGIVIFDDCSKQSKQTWILDELSELDIPVTLVRRRFGRIDDNLRMSLLQEICTFPNPMIFSLGEKEILFNENATSEILQYLDENHDGIFSSYYCSKFPLGLSKEQSELEINNFNIISSQRGLRLSKLDTLNSSPLFVKDRSSNFLEIEKYLVFNGNFKIGPIVEGTLRPTTYIPNLRKIELDITYICNLTCSGCSRSSAQAPSSMHMPIEVIQNFLRETETKGIRWESLHILGGEPTLHPDFVEIVLTLDEWFQRHSPETDLKVITNGVSKLTKSNIEKIPERWHYDNSFKIDFQKATSHFEPFNLAPIDLEEWKEQDFSKGCYITQDSGIGLTPYGYFHCAIAGGIERIMNLGHGLESIPEHPWEMLAMMEDYCKKCGHFLSDTFVERADRDGSLPPPDTVSLSWEMAYNQWKLDGDAGSKLKVI